jgi:hypothetical protein
VRHHVGGLAGFQVRALVEGAGLSHRSLDDRSCARRGRAAAGIDISDLLVRVFDLGLVYDRLAGGL